MTTESVPLDDVPPRHRELLAAAQRREQARGTDRETETAAAYRELAHAVPFRTLLGAAWSVTVWRARRWWRS